MSKLQVLSLVSQSIVAGAIKSVEVFYVADADGKLVGRKQHASEAEALAESQGLETYAEGLAFSQATNPELADKAHVGKAKVVAAYLAWVEAGRPEAAPVEATEEVVAEEVTTTEEAPVAEEDEDEDF